jgi:hypothetical protein
VLKEAELDLVFLAPKKPLDAATQGKLAAVSLDGAAERAELLDRVFHIAREGKEAGYALSLELGRVRTVVQKPRPCYLATVGGGGTPVFDAQGKLLGFTLNCQVAGGAEDEATDLSGSGSTFMAATLSMAGLGGHSSVLPAGEVRRLLAEAKEKMKSPGLADEK